MLAIIFQFAKIVLIVVAACILSIGLTYLCAKIKRFMKSKKMRKFREWLHECDWISEPLKPFANGKEKRVRRR